MASVDDIVDRLSREDGVYALYRPGLGTSRTEMMQAVTPAVNGEPVQWRPNRKVVASAVSGVVVLILSIVAGHTGIELDPAVASSVTAAVMALIGYLVPMADES